MTDIKDVLGEIIGQLGVSPELTFIYGSKAVQNLLADDVDVFPCVMLDSPRTGELTVAASGAVVDIMNVSYFVAEKGKQDELASTTREIIEEMKVYAAKILVRLVSRPGYKQIGSAKYIEVEGMFDANLTGIIVEVKIQLTNPVSIC